MYDVSDSVATTVEADVARTWDALMAADFVEVARGRPLVGLLGALRVLPGIAAHLLHGEAPPAAPKTLRLREAGDLPVDQGGWVLLGERPREEIALGQVAKFWRPVITYATVKRETFREFEEPGYAKTVYSLAVRPLSERRTMLSGTMRTATTDAQARRWFRTYWTLGVGSGAHVLVNGLLETVRESAEATG
ncbi:MAG TPA: hypothetical protein VFD38_04965 [Myxococcaceae bacterium]|nr:hypothetical protein [Myxococcaceae bacterium]